MSTPIGKTSPAPQHSLSPMFYAPSASNGSSSSSSPKIATPPLRRQSTGKNSLYDVTPAAKASPQGDYFSPKSASPLSEGRRGSRGKAVMIRRASGNMRPSSRPSLNNANPAALPYFPPPPTSGTGSPLTVSRRNSGARPGFAERSNSGTPQIRTDSGNIAKLKFSDQAKIYNYTFAKSADGFDLPNKWTMTLHIAPDIYLRNVEMTDDVVKRLNTKFPHWNSPSPLAAAQQLRNITKHVRLEVSYLVNEQNEALVANVMSVKRPGPDADPMAPKSAQGLMEDKLQSVQQSFKQELNNRKRSIYKDSRVGGFLKNNLNLHYVDPDGEPSQQRN